MDPFRTVQFRFNTCLIRKLSGTELRTVIPDFSVGFDSGSGPLYPGHVWSWDHKILLVLKIHGFTTTTSYTWDNDLGSIFDRSDFHFDQLKISFFRLSWVSYFITMLTCLLRLDRNDFSLRFSLVDEKTYLPSRDQSLDHLSHDSSQTTTDYILTWYRQQWLHD